MWWLMIIYFSLGWMKPYKYYHGRFYIKWFGKVYNLWFYITDIDDGITVSIYDKIKDLDLDVPNNLYNSPLLYCSLIKGFSITEDDGWIKKRIRDFYLKNWYFRYWKNNIWDDSWPEMVMNHRRRMVLKDIL